MEPYSGDPVLFQQLFWLYSHPALYILPLSLILTGAGLWLWKRRSRA
jgi:heme/copper-type cytochrome/quinol oxidase subunit 1